MDRMLTGKQTLLRIFIGEFDKHQHKALYVSILEQARELHLAGGSTFRGVQGFGINGRIHSDFPPDYAEDLPIIVELVDTEERIATFIKKIGPLLDQTLVTKERLHVHHYNKDDKNRHKPKKDQRS